MIGISVTFIDGGYSILPDPWTFENPPQGSFRQMISSNQPSIIGGYDMIIDEI